MSDEVLTQAEIWCRICQPVEFRKLIAERTAALLHPGRELELSRWLEHRAAADTAWEERQAKFHAEIFSQFAKELNERPFPQVESLEPERQSQPPSQPGGASQEVDFNSAAQRIADAWRDPKVFDEVMTENRRLNAEEAAKQRTDPLPIQDLEIPALMNHIVEEFRTITRVEGLNPREAAAYVNARISEEVEFFAVDPRSLEPQSHYPPDATEEQKAFWRQQENDPRLAAAERAAREERENIEMTTRHSIPSMSKEAKEEFVREVAKATESLTVETVQSHDPPKIKL